MSMSGLPRWCQSQRACLLMQEMEETQVCPWVRKIEPPGEGMAPHSSILAWRIPRTQELGGLQSMGLQRVGHDWSDLAHTSLLALIFHFINIGLLINNSYLFSVLKVWMSPVTDFYPFFLFQHLLGGQKERMMTSNIWQLGLLRTEVLDTAVHKTWRCFCQIPTPSQILFYIYAGWIIVF